jgi:hypothetical protein
MLNMRLATAHMHDDHASIDENLPNTHGTRASARVACFDDEPRVYMTAMVWNMPHCSRLLKIFNQSFIACQDEHIMLYVHQKSL